MVSAGLLDDVVP